MLVHMRTTVRLDEALMRQVKAEAARRGQTVTELIEKGLQLVLASGGGRTRRKRVVVPVSRATGGTHPGVDTDDSSALLDRLDGRP
jgi:ribbon-helix-helix CopG family protein